MLFGNYVEKLRDALERSDVSVTKKYQLVGNLVAPEVAYKVAQMAQARVA